MSGRTRRARRKKTPRIRIPRVFAPGVSITIVPGRALRVALVGATDDELFGVDLASGAYVRVQHEGIGLMNEDADDDDQQPRRFKRFTPTVISCVPRVDDPLDPGRPEALWLAEPPVRVGPLRPRQLRRLTNAVVAQERSHGLILNSRGPSVAYSELDPLADSVMLVEVDSKRLKLVAPSEDAVMLSIRWGGITQRFPIIDQRACAAARAHPNESLYGDALVRALGFKPGFALVAFDRVRDGYVRKIVITILQR